MQKQSFVDECCNFVLFLVAGLILKIYKVRTIVIYILLCAGMGYGFAHVQKLVEKAIEGM